MSEKRFFGFGEFGAWVRSQVQTLTDGLNLKANQNEVSDALDNKLDATAVAVDSAKLEGRTKAQVISDVQTALNLGTASTANIFVSTVDPVASDGKDGDLWIKHTP